jgi:hypothetical protein
MAAKPALCPEKIYQNPDTAPAPPPFKYNLPLLQEYFVAGSNNEYLRRLVRAFPDTCVGDYLSAAAPHAGAELSHWFYRRLWLDFTETAKA